MSTVKKKFKTETPTGPNKRRVTEEIAIRDAELEALQTKTWRSINPNGLVAQEVLAYVDIHRLVTPEHASKDISLSPEIVLSYAKALQRVGKVKISREPSVRKKDGVIMIRSNLPPECGELGL